MKKSNFLFVLLIFLLSSNLVKSEFNYFDKGKKLFDKNKFNESKTFFEKDIVFNPKNETSYLYLAKIFKEKEQDELEENNLNTVILLNPKNEEALNNLILLKIKKSDYSEAKDLISTFKLVCIKLCGEEDNINKKLKNSLNE